MKEITFEFGFRAVHRIEATEDGNLVGGGDHYMDMEDFNHYLELEKRVRHSDDYTDEDVEEWQDFDETVQDYGDLTDFIPKTMAVEVSVKDLSKNTEEKFVIIFEKYNPKDSWLRDYKGYKIILLPPSEKIEDPYFKTGKFFVHYEKVSALLTIEREDFDPAKFVVKEYFHKAEEEGAVVVYYDGIDLLWESEISDGNGGHTYSQIFE